MVHNTINSVEITYGRNFELLIQWPQVLTILQQLFVLPSYKSHFALSVTKNGQFTQVSRWYYHRIATNEGPWYLPKIPLYRVTHPSCHTQKNRVPDMGWRKKTESKNSPHVRDSVFWGGGKKDKSPCICPKYHCICRKYQCICPKCYCICSKYHCICQKKIPPYLPKNTTVFAQHTTVFAKNTTVCA